MLIDITVHIKQKLGGGGQAAVYECEIKGNKVDSMVRYASKVREVFNNPALSHKELKEAYHEYRLAKDLDHPNIIKYKYFAKQIIDQTDYYHIIMEIVQGQDLMGYLKANGPLPIEMI